MSERMAPIIPLRVHSAYSLLEGAMTVAQLVDVSKKEGFAAVGIADNHNLFGSLEFSQACCKAGIQPIIGCQFSYLPHDASAKPGERDQLLLIAKDDEGYANLLKLISRAYLHPEDEQEPLLSWETVADHAAGLIALTAGVFGGVGKALLKGNRKQAGTMAAQLHAAFGDRLYVELMRHGLDEERRIEPGLLEIAQAHNLPIVATNDAYFYGEAMYDAHDALICTADGRYVMEADRRRLTPNHRLKSTEEMRALFADLPEALENTAVIAQRCAVLSPARDPILPSFRIEEDGVVLSEADALTKVAQEGLEKRLQAHVYTSDMDAAARETVAKPYRERLDYELGIIIQMGFPGYFLIVSDFITWSKEQGIPVGPGRGSGAASVVAWSLLITDLDPLEYDLVFERFLNPERVSMPDFDIDFCQDRRDEVIRYVQQKYGADKVAQIITFGKLQARAVLRDVGRVLQMPYGQVDKICKLVPNNPANPVTLAQAIDMEPLLKAQMQEEEVVAQLVEISLKLEGLYRHASTHAAGVVIADRSLDELVPVYRDPKSDMPVVQYSMKYAEMAGLVKFDFLGLKTLTVLAKAVALVNQELGIGNWELESPPPDRAMRSPAPPQGGSYPSDHIEYAQDMRKEMTREELSLWMRLKDNQLGVKFRRQQPIGKYIVDFYCVEKKLILEVDGSQHAESEADSERDRWLEAQGYTIVRFWNSEVLDNIEGVVEKIIDTMDNSPLEGESKHGSASVGGEKLDINKIPLDDNATFQLLRDGKSVGVFQFESAGMRDSLRKLQPDRLEDLIALGALYRPGPMDNIPTYIARKHGKENPDYLHPSLEPVLKETYGVIIYQEQVQKIAQILSGYTLGAADLLRRAMGKKIQAEMDAQRKIFVEGAQKNGVSAKQANEIFDLVAKFAGYGFNKAHAAAYALIGYQTAYLKANYPVEFMAASMTYDMQNTDKLSVFKQDVEQLGYELLPPDINASEVEFGVETLTPLSPCGRVQETERSDGRLGEGSIPLQSKKAVRYALAAIKNVGEQAMEALVAERTNNGAYEDIFDVVCRVDPKVLNRRQFEHLVMAGVFDSLHPNRRQLFESLDMLLAYGQGVAEDRESNQVSLFGEGGVSVQRPAMKDMPEWPALEKLEKEYQAIGFYLSAHPLEGYASALSMLKVKDTASVASKLGAEYVKVKLAGIVMGRKIKNGQRGRFAFVQFSDTSGVYEASIFDETVLDASRELLETGTIVLLVGEAKMEEAGPRIIIREMRLLEDALKASGRQGGALTLVIDTPEAVPSVKAILCEPDVKGMQVTLKASLLEHECAVIALQQRYRLSPEAMLTLQQLDGVAIA